MPTTKPDDLPNKNFHTAIRLLMAERDLVEYKQVAAELDLPQQTIYKIMDGSNNPTLEHFRILARVGGFSLNWLLLGIGDKYFLSDKTLALLMGKLKEVDL